MIQVDILVPKTHNIHKVDCAVPNPFELLSILPEHWIVGTKKTVSAVEVFPRDFLLLKLVAVNLGHHPEQKINTCRGIRAFTVCKEVPKFIVLEHGLKLIPLTRKLLLAIDCIARKIVIGEKQRFNQFGLRKLYLADIETLKNFLARAVINQIRSVPQKQNFIEDEIRKVLFLLTFICPESFCFFAFHPPASHFVSLLHII